MRAAAAAIVGLLIGGILGFALRGWFVEEAPTLGEEPTAPRQQPDARVASAPSSPLRSPAEPLRPNPEATPAVEAAAAVASAADGLVGVLVYGAVIDPDGRPAKLGNWRWVKFDRGTGEPVSTEVLATSTYAVSGLKPGTYSVRLDTEGHRPFSHTLELDAAHPAVRFDIVLQPAVVLVVKAVTPAGEPLMGALRAVLGGDHWSSRLGAVATRAAPPALLPEISHRTYDRWDIGYYLDAVDMSFGSGSDALPDDAIGKLRLDEPLPAYVSLVFRHIVVQTQTIEPGATDVVFVVPVSALEQLLGGVRVRVVDAQTRQPIADAKADLSDSQSMGGGKSADAAGVFTWERQRPGLLELAISAPDHETWDGEISVPPGGVADLGTIELTPATTVAGIVLDQAGNPVSVSLRALADEGRGLGMGARRYAKSGADGRFECVQLGRREYRLVVSDDEWSALPVRVDLRQGNLDGVVIAVAAGTSVRLRTSWPAGERYGVCVTTKDGLVLSDSDDWRGDWTWSRRILPGDYVAILSSAGSELKRVPFHVGDEELAIDLAP